MLPRHVPVFRLSNLPNFGQSRNAVLVESRSNLNSPLRFRVETYTSERTSITSPNVRSMYGSLAETAVLYGLD